MKYLLILYVCSYATAEMKCNNESITGSFDNWSACINQGYKQSHFLLNELYKEDFERDYIERERIVVKFECRKVGEKV